MAKLNFINVPNTDWFFEVSAGRISGHAGLITPGHSTNLSSNVEEDVWQEGGDLSYLSSAETMEIVSTSPNDSSAGTGLQTLLVTGLDNSFVEISEVVLMDGVGNVTTTKSYIRVNSLVGLTAGLTGWNEGIITATATTAGTVQEYMDIAHSISQSSHYTVPLGKSLIPLRADLNIAKVQGGGTPTVEFKAYIRLGGVGAAWVQIFDKKIDGATSDELSVVIPIIGVISIEKTDIRIRAVASSNNTEVRTRMSGVLFDN